LFSIFLGLFGLYSSYRIKKEDIEKEDKNIKPKVPGYIPLKARKEKTLIIGLFFLSVGILFLIKSII
jgi:hypothetical protein